MSTPTDPTPAEARALLLTMAEQGWYVPGESYPVLSTAADVWIKRVQQLVPLAFATPSTDARSRGQAEEREREIVARLRHWAVMMPELTVLTDAADVLATPSTEREAETERRLEIRRQALLNAIDAEMSGVRSPDNRGALLKQARELLATTAAIRSGEMPVGDAPKRVSGEVETFTNPHVQRIAEGEMSGVYVWFDAPNGDIQPFIMDDEHAQALLNGLAAARPTTDRADGDDGWRYFLDAIHQRTPTGAWIAVQHHPNGDWSVAHHPLPWLPGGERAVLCDPAGYIQTNGRDIEWSSTPLTEGDRKAGWTERPVFYDLTTTLPHPVEPRSKQGGER